MSVPTRPVRATARDASRACPAGRRRPLAGLVAVAVVAGCLLAPPAGASAVGRRSPSATPRPGRVGVAPRIPSGSTKLGRLPGGRLLELEVLLRPRREQTLAALVHRVVDPGARGRPPLLARGAFARRFGAGATEVAAARRALLRLGLPVTGLSADRLALRVRTTVAGAERAFATPLVRYRLASGRTGFANLAAPRLGPGIAPEVLGVLGLDTLEPEGVVGLDRLPRASTGPGDSSAGARLVHGAASPTASCATLIQTGGAGYTAGQIADAYGYEGLYGAGDFGVHTTIGVIEFSGFDPSDLAAYAAATRGWSSGSRSSPSTGARGAPTPRAWSSPSSTWRT